MSKLTPYSKSDPTEKESKLANFSHRSSKFFSQMLDSKDTCTICQCSFKLITTNKFFCSSCTQAVCKDHSAEVIGETIERICYRCRDEKIREETESKSQELKEKLFQEIRELQDERGSKTREISKIGTKIRKFENEYKENLLRNNVEQEELKDDLDKQKAITAAVEAEYREIKMQLEVAQISEGKAGIKLKRVSEVLQGLKVEVETMESEGVDQKYTLDEIKVSASQRVPIKMVKENLCKLCLMKVSLTHAVMFKNVRPMTEEKRISVHGQEDVKVKICTCGVF